jgi:hypothetical protein
MRVTQFIGRSGHPVMNHMVITDGEVTYFKSYHSIIVKIAGGVVYLDQEKWDYSPTTSKHRNAFLGTTTEEIKAGIKLGKYILADLNT